MSDLHKKDNRMTYFPTRDFYYVKITNFPPEETAVFFLFPTVSPARFTVSISRHFPYQQLIDSTSSMHPSALRLVRRGLATAAAHPPHTSPSASHVTAASSAIPLSNVEAQWATLSPTEQTVVHQQLEELQRKDWKSLSLSEKKAGASILYLIYPCFLPLRLRGEESVEFVVHVACPFYNSLLCRVWPSWTSCASQPTWHSSQDPHWHLCPRWHRRPRLRWHPLSRYASSHQYFHHSVLTSTVLNFFLS
jgi:hypothetical protein